MEQHSSTVLSAARSDLATLSLSREDRIMSDEAKKDSRIIGGVDTHKDTHTAAALDATGRTLGSAVLRCVGGRGMRRCWLGFEVSVSSSASASRGRGHTAPALPFSNTSVIRACPSSRVNRPNRQTRRRHGKSDPVDAQAAARAALAGDAERGPQVSGRGGRSDPHPASLSGDRRSTRGRRRRISSTPSSPRLPRSLRSTLRDLPRSPC